MSFQLIPQFTAPSYGDKTLNQIQRCVNLYPQEGPNGWQLVSMPGYAFLATVDASHGFRGAYYSTTGKLFCVTNGTVWEMFGGGVSGSRGSVSTGASLVHMTDNGTDLLIVVDGAGYSLTMASGSVAAISDANFPSASHCAFQDGYFIVTKSGTDIFYLSALLSATNWTPQTFATAESKGDTLVGVYSNGTHIYLLGKQSLEVWYNTGNASFPFERINGGIHFIGCPSVAMAAMLDGVLYFVSGAANGGGSIWAAAGTEIKKISNPYIDSITSAFNSSYVFAICFKAEGSSFLQITSSTTITQTLVYNITNGTWFERASFAGVTSYENSRFVVNALDLAVPKIFGFVGGSVANAVFVGDANAEITTSTAQIVRQRIFGPIESNTNRVFHSQIRIEAEIQFDSAGTTSIAPTLDWTDDDGLTYSTAITLTKTVISSTAGQRVLFTANRLGSSARRYYRLTFTGPAAKIILKKCELDLREGRF